MTVQNEFDTPGLELIDGLTLDFCCKKVFYGGQTTRITYSYNYRQQELQQKGYTYFFLPKKADADGLQQQRRPTLDNRSLEKCCLISPDFAATFRISHKQPEIMDPSCLVLAVKAAGGGVMV